MFDVADELGGKFSSLRDVDGGVRFESKDLIFGRPEQAALGVEHYMCVDDNKLRKRMLDGVQAIRDEVRVNGSDDGVDEECLEYVLYQEAGSSGKTFGNSPFPRDCDENGVRDSRKNADGTGMRLADFVAHPNAKKCKLNEAHVAALRLYTTMAFRTINNGLRDQERFQAGLPHALPVTVAFIKEALGKLRAVAGSSREANTEVALYRGMAGMRVNENFLQQGKGGTELAPMSTTSSLKIAMQYSASQNALLLRLRTSNFMVRGPDISFLSAFPAEQEFLFPPLTYLAPTGEMQTLRVDDARFTVIDVQPTMP
jgi:hypothetical protein